MRLIIFIHERIIQCNRINEFSACALRASLRKDQVKRRETGITLQPPTQIKNAMVHSLQVNALGIQKTNIGRDYLEKVNTRGKIFETYSMMTITNDTLESFIIRFHYSILFNFNIHLSVRIT